MFFVILYLHHALAATTHTVGFFIVRSAYAHERKPNIGFYQYLIKETNLNPSEAIFVDDKLENVLTARSTGMGGIVFDNADSVVRQLMNRCGNPIERGNTFLRGNKKMLKTVSDKGVLVNEVRLRPF